MLEGLLGPRGRRKLETVRREWLLLRIQEREHQLRHLCEQCLSTLEPTDDLALELKRLLADLDR